MKSYADKPMISRSSAAMLSSLSRSAVAFVVIHRGRGQGGGHTARAAHCSTAFYHQRRRGSPSAHNHSIIKIGLALPIVNISGNILPTNVTGNRVRVTVRVRPYDLPCGVVNGTNVVALRLDARRRRWRRSVSRSP
jgi:hypothetical protein